MTAVIAPTRLEELAGLIDAEYEQVWRAGEVALEHAIQCGKYLLEAQAAVPRGDWLVWLRANVRAHPTTAYRWMRIARNERAVRESGAANVDAAVAAVASDPWHNRTRLDEQAKIEMVKMAREHGMSLDEIAQHFGVAISTVHYWVSPKNLERRRRKQRSAQARHRKTKQVRAVAKAARAMPTDATFAYSLIRRAAQKVDNAAREVSSTDARRAFDRALRLIHEAEDEIAKGIRLTVDTRESQS